MRLAIYNSGIPQNCLKSVNRAASFGLDLSLAISIFVFVLLGPTSAWAADWSGPEQQLARKIVAVTGPGAVALTYENRSSLDRRDADIVQNGLRNSMEQAGIRFVESEQAAANITISLSEDATAYVWVASIRQSAGEAAVVMVAVPRTGGAVPSYSSMPLSLRKTPLWTQVEPILDVAVLEESQAVTRIAVLGPERVSIYRMQGGKWQEEQAMEIAHTRPWPRDLRGRLVPAKDHLLDAYLPGVICHSTAGSPQFLNCRDSEDPWPLVPVGMTSASVFPSMGSANTAAGSIPLMSAFFAPTRNFFTGVVTPSISTVASLPKFYSAASLPRGKYTLWLLSAVDGQIHVVDGMRDQASKFGWGSDIATLKTSCGAGWQVLATSSTDAGTSAVRAYEMPDRDPIAVSASTDFPGTLTALWTEMNADSAVAVVRNQGTGNYEAYRLAVACNQ
jgi:hypothetical protein